MSKLTDNAQKAVLAINNVASTPGADIAQRLIALHQVERHVQGQIRAVSMEAGGAQHGGNPVSQRTGD